MKGSIYTITHKTNKNWVYVGYTTRTLKKRWYGHKSSAKNGPHFIPFHQVMTDFDDWIMELYEEIEADSKYDILERESEIIQQIGTMNKTIYKKGGKYSCNYGTIIQNPLYLDLNKKMI